MSANARAPDTPGVDIRRPDEEHDSVVCVEDGRARACGSDALDPQRYSGRRDEPAGELESRAGS